MKARVSDPRRLDVEAFARQSGHLDGEWPLASLERLATLLLLEPAVPARVVTWQVDGETARERAGSGAQLWLQLRAAASLPLVCQRCLGSVEVPVALDRRIRFARDEETAAVLDAELDDDVLALTRALDLRVLVEDELLLALPLVPRHERCPPDASAPAASDAQAAARSSPFAALAALKKPGDAG